MKEKCSFCKKYGLYTRLDRMSKNKVIMNEYTVAMIQSTYCNGRESGRTFLFKKDGSGFPLNFCPECGKKLE